MPLCLRPRFRPVARGPKEVAYITWYNRKTKRSLFPPPRRTDPPLRSRRRRREVHAGRRQPGPCRRARGLLRRLRSWVVRHRVAGNRRCAIRIHDCTCIRFLIWKITRTRVQRRPRSTQCDRGCHGWGTRLCLALNPRQRPLACPAYPVRGSASVPRWNGKSCRSLIRRSQRASVPPGAALHTPSNCPLTRAERHRKD